MYQVESEDDITRDYLGKTLQEFRKDKMPHLVQNIAYAEGRNPAILDRKLPDDTGPDNRIPVSYARRIINLVVGYMYSPGLVNYTFAEGDEDKIMPIFNANNEPTKTAQMGKEVSIHGAGYEYHYVQGDGASATPRFVRLSAPEVVPIYDEAIEPKLLAFIRQSMVDKDTVKLMVANDREIAYYTMPKDGDVVTSGEVEPHFYGQVPLVVYQNNEEIMGDFEAVEPLIDAYDVLVSDSMNEFDRFAWAYLVLKGMGSLTEEDAANMKRLRVLELFDEKSTADFLTKTIDTQFIDFMATLLRGEIHRQSGIPNFDDYDGAGASGKTLSKFIYLMELFTDPKESYFVEGLYDRLNLINQILAKQKQPINMDDVNIVMNRNAPDNSKEQAEIYGLYSGHISEPTLMENFADFVDDVPAEMELVEEQRASQIDVFTEVDEEETPEAVEAE